MRTNSVIVFFVLECLSFIKCCSGAKQTIDTASREMKGRVVFVSLHACMLNGSFPEMACEKGESYARPFVDGDGGRYREGIV